MKKIVVVLALVAASLAIGQTKEAWSVSEPTDSGIWMIRFKKNPVGGDSIFHRLDPKPQTGFYNALSSADQKDYDRFLREINFLGSAIRSRGEDLIRLSGSFGPTGEPSFKGDPKMSAFGTFDSEPIELLTPKTSIVEARDYIERCRYRLKQLEDELNKAEKQFFKGKK